MPQMSAVRWYLAFRYARMAPAAGKDWVNGSSLRLVGSGIAMAQSAGGEDRPWQARGRGTTHRESSWWRRTRQLAAVHSKEDGEEEERHCVGKDGPAATTMINS